MLVTVTNDDGEVQGSYKVPNRVTPSVLEDILCDGLWNHEKFVLCTECGCQFVSDEDAVEANDGDTMACPECAKKLETE